MAKREMSDKELARKLGVAESTIRSRRARGQKLDAPPQIRLTRAQMQRIARARGTTQEVADKFGVSVSTVKRLRRLYGASTKSAKTAKSAKATKKGKSAKRGR